MLGIHPIKISLYLIHKIPSLPGVWCFSNIQKRPQLIPLFIPLLLFKTKKEP